jgi:hypothetical protein
MGQVVRGIVGMPEKPKPSALKIAAETRVFTILIAVFADHFQELLLIRKIKTL